MQIPGLLVEYLIGGSVAMIWLLPALHILGLYTQGTDEGILAIFLPGLYVVGMIVDFIGWFITRPHRRYISLRVRRKLDVGKEELDALEDVLDTQILLHAPQLAKAREMRSSRDRIARNTVVNAILTTIVLAVYAQQVGSLFASLASIAIGVVMTLMCWAMWARYQRLSYRYDVVASRTVSEERQRKREASSASGKATRSAR